MWLRIVWFVGLWVIAVALLLGALAHPAHADPNSCPDRSGQVGTFTTYVPCPRWDFLPPRSDGGNHRWPDGSDD